MSNQIVGNVLIIDSAMGTSTFLITNSAQMPDQLYINTIKLSMSDTTAKLQVSQAADANAVVVELDRFESLIHFSNPQVFRKMRINTLTAGTAWFYLA